MPCKHRHASGFTLVEVLIALLIVTLGIAAAIQASGQSANNQIRLKEKTLAHWVAQNQLTELRLNEAFPSLGKDNGSMDMGGERWRWEMETKATDAPNVRRVEISVKREDGDEPITDLIGFFSGTDS